MIRHVAAASLVALSLLYPAAAQADSASDGRAAEALFTEGRHLMTAGKFDEACPKLAESQRLDPAPGTALNLATCYERAGRTASAWFAFRDAEALAASAGQKERAAVARKKASMLEPKLPRVTVVVAAESLTPGLEIRSDGAVLSQAAWGTAMPMDPGSHDIVATAPGRLKWTTKVAVDSGLSRQSVSIPKLELDPTTVAAAPPTPATSADPAAAATSTLASEPVASAPTGLDSGTSRGRTQRIAGLTVGAVGLVAVGIGTYFGFQASSTYSDALAACGGTPACTTDRGLQLRHDADPQMMASTIAFIAGGALVAGGAIVFFTAPKKAATSRVGMAVTPSRGSGAVFSMQGAW
jgi:hypothetical protein